MKVCDARITWQGGKKEYRTYTEIDKMLQLVSWSKRMAGDGVEYVEVGERNDCEPHLFYALRKLPTDQMAVDQTGRVAPLAVDTTKWDKEPPRFKGHDYEFISFDELPVHPNCRCTPIGASYRPEFVAHLPQQCTLATLVGVLTALVEHVKKSAEREKARRALMDGAS